MKYTQRKKTPLKWLNFLKYLGIPLQILLLLYVLVSMLFELFGSDVLPKLLDPVLHVYGLHFDHLGAAFWPILGVMLLLIVWIYCLFEIEKGLLRWNTFAPVGWNIFIVFVYLIKAAAIVLAMMYLPHSTVATVVMGYFVNFGLHIPASFMASGSLLAISVILLIIGLIFVCLNIIYFLKRRVLFAKNYQEEAAEVCIKHTQNETAATLPEDETAGYTQVISTAIEKDTSDVQEPSGRSCPSCGAPVLEEDAKYCTVCGHHL